MPVDAFGNDARNNVHDDDEDGDSDDAEDGDSDNAEDGDNDFDIDDLFTKKRKLQ